MDPDISVPNMLDGRNMLAQKDGVDLIVRIFTFLNLT